MSVPDAVDLLHGAGNAVELILIASSGQERHISPEPEDKPAKTQKKRGRKKKVTKSMETRDDTQQAEQELAPVPSEEPKRKRGRPRKSGTLKSPAAAAAAEISTESPWQLVESRIIPGTTDSHEQEQLRVGDQDQQSKWTNTGQSSKIVTGKGKDNGSSQRAGEPLGSGVLREKNDNPMGPPQASATPLVSAIGTIDGVGENHEANQAKKSKNSEESRTDAAKSDANGCQPGKALFRVGLSKKSRIAPLLKSFRK